MRNRLTFIALFLPALLGPAVRAAGPEVQPAWATRLETAVRRNAALRESPAAPEGAGDAETEDAAPVAAVTARRIADTRHGRPVMLVHITLPGSEPRHHVFVVTGQHGDEPAGPEAMLSLIEEFATGENPGLAETLSDVDLSIVPVANPDGFAAGTRLMPGGTNLNRDWNARRTTEARAIWQAIRDARPDVLFDLHEDTPRDIPGAYVDMANPGGAYGFMTLVAAAFHARGYDVPVRSRTSWTSAGLLHAAFARAFHRPAFLVETKYHGAPLDGLEERAAVHTAAVMSVAGSFGPGPAPRDPALRMISAAKHGDAAALEALLREYPDAVNGTDGTGATPLHVAVAFDQPEAVALLLAGGADVNAAKKDGVTPLHVAAGVGRADVVGPLLDAGADPEGRDIQARTPLSIARERGDSAIVDLLTAAMARTP